jgi:hypothetical protein
MRREQAKHIFNLEARRRRQCRAHPSVQLLIVVRDAAIPRHQTNNRVRGKTGAIVIRTTKNAPSESRPKVHTLGKQETRT